MHSLRLSDRTMSYDAGLSLMLHHHQQPPNSDHIEEAGTIILNPHNGATIKGKSHRKISTGKKPNSYTSSYGFCVKTVIEQFFECSEFHGILSVLFIL